MKLYRSALSRPGYDCVVKPCGVDGCGERPGSSHGRHCTDWVYAVHSRRASLSLIVFSGEFGSPEITAEMASTITWPMIADLTLCATYQVPPGEYVYNANARDCRWLDRCFTHASWGLRASSVWELCGGRRQFDQTEAFWRELEAAFLRICEERSLVLE